MEKIKIMEIKKLTPKYNLFKEKDIYYLSFGAIKKGEDTTTKLQFTDVDSKTFQIAPACQCTTSNKKIIDNNTVEADISINTSGVFSKVITLKNNGKTTLLKLTGTVIN